MLSMMLHALIHYMLSSSANMIFSVAFSDAVVNSASYFPEPVDAGKVLNKFPMKSVFKLLIIG
jgi:hypothetical protein